MSCLLPIQYTSDSLPGLAIREFLKRRSEFKDILSRSNLNPNRYLRLMTLAAADIGITVPLTTWCLYSFSTNILYAWDYNWVHTNWDVVWTYPAVLWRSQDISYVNVELGRWVYVLGVINFFIFFGFSEEARKHYGHLAKAGICKTGWNFSVLDSSFNLNPKKINAKML